jgi:hypothetical protein
MLLARVAPRTYPASRQGCPPYAKAGRRRTDMCAQPIRFRHRIASTISRRGCFSCGRPKDQKAVAARSAPTAHRSGPGNESGLAYRLPNTPVDLIGDTLSWPPTGTKLVRSAGHHESGWGADGVNRMLSPGMVKRCHKAWIAEPAGSTRTQVAHPEIASKYVSALLIQPMRACAARVPGCTSMASCSPTL